MRCHKANIFTKYALEKFILEKIIDLSHEVAEYPRLVDKTRTWLATDLTAEDWTIQLGQIEHDEIYSMIKKISENPAPMYLRHPDQFDIPNLRKAYTKCKTNLQKGVGFSVIDKLPIDVHEIDEIVSVYWILGQLIGPNVAQKWDGTMVYDVTDTKKKYEYGVRGSATNIELVFHTDNAFGRRVPDSVGLLCRNHAKSGGLSRFCSLYSLHSRMEDNYSDELARLYQPVYFDRQAEHAKGAPIVTFAPFFSWSGDNLRCRANTSLIRKGYELAGQEMDFLLLKAIQVIEEVTSSPDLWIEAPLKRGEVQYLNNHELGHYRSDFEDYDDIDKKRHLYRLWHRSDGDITYDG